MVEACSFEQSIGRAREWSLQSAPGDLGRVFGSPHGLFLVGFLDRLPRPCLVVASTAGHVETLRDQLAACLEKKRGPTRNRKVFSLPAWDVRPYGEISAYPETLGSRVEALYELSTGENPIVVTAPEALFQKVVPKSKLVRAPVLIVVGDRVDLDCLLLHTTQTGYRRASLVTEPGQMSVRGGIVDLFPPGYPLPVRIEINGDEVESIRAFAPSAQRSVEQLDQVLILPVNELWATWDTPEEVASRILKRSVELDLGRDGRDALIQQFSEGSLPPGGEFLAPFFSGSLVPVFDYFPSNTLIVTLDPELQEGRIQALLSEVELGINQARLDRRLYANPEELYLSWPEWNNLLENFSRINVGGLESPPPIGEPEKAIRVLSEAAPMFGSPIRPLRTADSNTPSFLTQFETWISMGWRVLILAPGEGKLRIWKDLLEDQGTVFSTLDRLDMAFVTRAKKGLYLACGFFSEGAVLPLDRMAVVTHEEMLGGRRGKRRRTKLDPTLFLSSLSELKMEDLIVHVDHGVGVYHGLKHLSISSTEGDFLHIEYADGDKLYLPVDRINLVQKYVGSDHGKRQLDRLGGLSWEKLKTRTKESILAMSSELAEIHAQRELSGKKGLPEPDVVFREFEETFDFEETEDQRKTIEEVLDDLQRDKPMDRLVCGDVGFGKTEIAVRATFHAVMNGRQAAILAPTTILAKQHWTTFSDRFAGYPIRIGLLSRFSHGEEKKLLPQIGSGGIDVVIGTHRLLQEDVTFHNLGLLVVDEEHRFGVAHKEKLKRLRPEVDVLTLTATPIPRTLQMALSAVRELSVIATPPPDRLSVRTYVCPYRESLIRDAILSELARKGQTFFVHNRVRTIDVMARKLAELVPEARFGVAHGELGNVALERVMSEFMEGTIDVLVCSTIIESGLDIPNANTLIVNRADRFGLAELYQLRGRVGRSTRLAHAYLLTPPQRRVTESALLRLQALQELDDLGGGFRLAMHDLEIRGAGNILGSQQSGHIAAVGLELYTQMVDAAIKELAGQRVKTTIEPEISIGVSAYLPQQYIPDTNQRLLVYKRLANVMTDGDVSELLAELRDRYGEPPHEAKTLVEVMELRRSLKDIMVTRFKYNEGVFALEFHPDSPVSPEKLVQLIHGKKEGARLLPDMTLLFPASAKAGAHILAEAKQVLGELGSLCEFS